MPVTSLAPGTQLDGRYQVVQHIGEGGMASVYEVEHLALKTRLALKVLHADLAANEEVRARFLLEGRIQAGLRHPNILQVTEIVTHPVPGLVMELVKGPTLAELLGQGGRMDAPVQVLEVFLPVLDAMGLAHRQGVVHRDLKPENILLGEAQGRMRPAVTDFGIARRLDGGGVRQTRAGAKMGTVQYMSPEQVRGADGADARSDIFSLGAILYELVTGKRAFDEANDFDTQRAIVEGRYVAPRERAPGVHPVIEASIVRALATKPEERFPTCEAFAEALSACVAPAAPQAVEVRPARGGRWKYAAALLLVASALAGAYLATLAGGPSDDFLAMVESDTGAPRLDVPGVADRRARYFKECARGQLVACQLEQVSQLPLQGEGAPLDADALGKACLEGQLSACPVAARGLSQSAPLLAYKTAWFGCEKGLAAACVELGKLHEDGTGVPRDEARAVALYGQACNAGSARGCDRLGVMLSEGKGCTKDATGAAALFRKSCDAGSAAGCARLGTAVRRGEGTAKDEARGLALLDKACEAGDPRACSQFAFALDDARNPARDAARAALLFEKVCSAAGHVACARLGAMYLNGDGVSKDEATAAGYLEKGCDGGDGDACYGLGSLHARGAGVQKDDARAAVLFEKACGVGISGACNAFGISLQEGRGVRRDDGRAAALYKKACDTGEPAGCYNLGLLLAVGRGVAMDQAGAAMRFDQACNAGMVLACNRMGEVLEYGTGVAQDETRAAALYEKACNGGRLEACTHLGLLAEAGRGTGKDPAKAAALYSRACDGGNRDACTGLGLLYRKGQGVPADLARAAQLFQKACAAGDRTGCEQADFLR
ncbi:MAG: hypothetical protein RL653_4472 [Pseudomonadota bacterium]|jgi:TPR repeat protein/tRNA A-37 threonylcarbamoyl transferase component Bud32